MLTKVYERLIVVASHESAIGCATILADRTPVHQNGGVLHDPMHNGVFRFNRGPL